ncbi:MAG: peptidylprolyl isomerase, partial [Marmoricola sp.]|nr:peptidylprolyl isomerase [Marmoricola sp.]
HQTAALLATISPKLRLRTALVLVVPALVLSACGSSDKVDASPGSSGTTPASAACTYPDESPASKPVKKPSSTPDPKNPKSMVISTSAGDIPIAFDSEQAPCTVNSFVSLANQGYFNNTTCHRITTAGIFVLQCGDPTGTGTGGPGYTLPDEIVANDPRLQPCAADDGSGVPPSCTYTNGSIAMANTGQPNSGGSQFFLMYDDSPLPNSYTVFGHTDAGGLKVLKAIGAKGTANPNGDGAPKTPVDITSVK